MTEGTKHDQGKPRMELIPGEALMAVATILTFGSAKYEINYEDEWDRLLDAPDVTGIEIATQLGCVVAVTKNTSEELTLSLPKDKNKTVGIGRNAIQTKLRKTTNVGRAIRKLVSETQELRDWEHLLNMDSQKTVTENSSKRGAAYVDQQNSLTLTIATRQGNLEVFFVPDATTDLGFWEIIWKDLAEQLGISKPLNRTGDRNWEAGMSWSRVFGALMRHMWCWWQGKAGSTVNFAFGSLDEETSFSHLWHALACVVFLVTYEERAVGKDDRPVSKIKQ